MKRWFPVTAIVLGVLFSPLAEAGENGARLGIFAGFELGKHNLSDVQARFGPAQIRHVGDAGESEYSICYRHPSGSIRFASGELGGPDHQLLTFRLSKQAPPQSCATWPSTIPLTLGFSNIRVGMSRSEYTKALAHAVTWVGTKGTAAFQSAHQIGGTTLDVVVTIEGTFNSAGRLQSVAVFRTETN
jgi:hypothetical protein